jgi:hypothetical protein
MNKAITPLLIAFGLLVLVIFPPSCTTKNPNPPEPALTAEECGQLGVATQNNTGPMLPVITQTVGTFDTVYNGCLKENGIDSHITTVAGCIYEANDNSGYKIFASDENSLRHEWCHALYGKRHTR